MKDKKLVNIIFKLIGIVMNLIYEQGTRDCSGTKWAQEKIDACGKLQDKLNQLK